MSVSRVTEPTRLRELFSSVIAGEGGTYAADRAAGLRAGTFSRWTTHPESRPADARLRQLARALGTKYGFTETDVLTWAGYLSANAPDPPELTPADEQVLLAQAEIGRFLSEARRDFPDDAEFALFRASVVRNLRAMHELARLGRREPGGG